MTTTITADPDAVRVIRNALDLYQRVAMGQWREILEHCPEVTDAGMFSGAGDALMVVRTTCAKVEALYHPNASLGIMRAGDDARIACDIWHQLGGGMESRRNDRLSGAHVEVTS